MPDIFTQKTTPITKPELPSVNTDSENMINPLVQSTILSSITRPTGISFQGQDPQEEILLYARRAGITNLPWVLLILVCLLVSLTFPFLSPITSLLPSNLLPLLLLTYYVSLFTYGLLKFMNWFYNVSIVTRKRLIDIDFSDLTYHDVAYTNLKNVEDVHYAQSGFLRNFLNFGDVHALTASDKANFEALAIANPKEMSQLIAALSGKGHHAN